MSEPKLRWADIEDEDEEPVPQVTRHGIKVVYVPPHLRPEKKGDDRPKKTKPIESNKKR